jgi:predicted enzyme related to lactoylglutathione lyase
MGLAHGTFGWVDLASPEPQAAADFYNKVLGWEARPAEGGMPYTMFYMNGENVAGMGELTEEMSAGGMPSVWASYIIVDDVEATLKKAVELGAMPIMEVLQVGDTGRMAFIIDPAGAAIGLWESGTHDGASVFNVPGALTWNELQCFDVPAAKTFYSSLLGWETETSNFGELEYTLIKNDGRSNGGIMDITGMAPEGVPAYWAAYFVVDDCDAVVEAARSNGGTIMMGPADSEVGRMAAIADPFGAVFTVIDANQVDGQPPR